MHTELPHVRPRRARPWAARRPMRRFAGLSAVLMACLIPVAALAAPKTAAGAQADTSDTATATAIADDWQLCRSAARKVERAHDLPDALLQAMSLVETGRRAPDGRHTAWPWTINAEGKGFRFANKEDALLAVRRMMADGVRSIDVGCMQVNLRYHPRAFTSLDEAFDPAANMAYAASFLQDLKNRHGNWRAASARYHSYNPKLREKYAERVDATLISERKAIAALVPHATPAGSTAPPAADTGGSEIITASVVSLGLRPTLIPGLRRGFDMPERPAASRDAAGLSPAHEPTSPHPISARSTQLAAR